MPQQLLQPKRIFSRAEVLQRPCPVPKDAGIYAWYFSGLSHLVPQEDCTFAHGLPLLYVGIAPRRDPTNGAPPSSQRLWHRVRYHFKGNAEGSTLRLTLGCLLAADLGLELRRVGSGKRMTFQKEGEAILSDWMDKHAFVTWHSIAKPWEAEHKLISSLKLPLNLDMNKAHPFHAQLSTLRKVAKASARRQRSVA